MGGNGRSRNKSLAADVLVDVVLFYALVCTSGDLVVMMRVGRVSTNPVAILALFCPACWPGAFGVAQGMDSLQRYGFVKAEHAQTPGTTELRMRVSGKTAIKKVTQTTATTS